MRKYAHFTIIAAHSAASKTMSVFDKTAHRATFAYVPREGFIYVRSRMISSRCNDNYDEFPAEEIRKGWRSFIGKPVFVNHKNDNIDEARGVIMDAALHDDVNPDGSPDLWVEGLMEVDARSYPKLAEKILAGEIDKTSMGCDVDFSVCSACGNKAYTPLDYCAHIPKQKGLKLTRRNAATGAQEDVLIREICYGLRFFENSLLVEDPADPTAFFTGVDDRGVGGGYTGGLPKAASKMANEQGRMIDGHGNPVTYTEESLKARIEDLKYYGGNGPDYVRGVNDAIRDALRYIGLGDLETANYWLDRAESGVRERIDRNRKAIEEYVPGQRNQNQPWLDVPPSPMGGPLAKQSVHENRYVDDPNAQWRTVLDLGAKDIEDAASEEEAIETYLAIRDGYDASVPVRIQRRVNGEWVNVDPPAGVMSTPEAGWPMAASKRASIQWKDQYGDGTMFFSADDKWGVFFDDDGWYLSEYIGPDNGPYERHLVDVFDTVEEAKAYAESDGAYPKLSYGERTAPPEIDTLRDEKCPVCGETDGFSGDRCMICNYVKPPDPFMDPDLDIAQQVDLRQDQDENQGVDNKADKPKPPPPAPGAPAPDAGGELACDMCGATFDASKPVGDLKPVDDKSRVPGPRQDPSQPVETTDGRVEVEVRDGQPSPDRPDAEGLSDSHELPKPKHDPEEADPNAQIQPQPGETCPNCGEGTLQPMAPQAPQDGPPHEDKAKPTDDAQRQSKPPFVKEDNDKSAPEKSGDNPADPVEDEETPPKDRKKQKESTVRQSLRMIQELQIRQQAHSQQINAIASAAGMVPQIQAIEAKGTERIARLRRSADVENPAQPVPSPGSEAPTTTTAEEISPISPMSPAGGSLGNEVTTPGSTTETDVAPDAQTNLLDPVAACRKVMASRGLDPVSASGPYSDFIMGQDYSGSTAAERQGYGEFVGGRVANSRYANAQGTIPAPPNFQTWKRMAAAPKTADAILDEPLDLNELDVTKPVAGTEGPRPIEEVRIETEVRQTDSVDGSNDINSAQGVPGVNSTPPQKVGSQEPTPEERFYAAQRLATLRISAGMEQGDPLVLGQRIAASDIDNLAIVTEIDALQRVAKAAAMNPAHNLDEGPGQPVAPRNMVPRTAASVLPEGVDRMTPSMTAGVTVPQVSMANGPTADEFMFE